LAESERADSLGKVDPFKLADEIVLHEVKSLYWLEIQTGRIDEIVNPPFYELPPKEQHELRRQFRGVHLAKYMEPVVPYLLEHVWTTVPRDIPSVGTVSYSLKAALLDLLMRDGFDLRLSNGSIFFTAHEDARKTDIINDTRAMAVFFKLLKDIAAGDATIPKPDGVFTDERSYERAIMYAQLAHEYATHTDLTPDEVHGPPLRVSPVVPCNVRCDDVKHGVRPRHAVLRTEHHDHAVSWYTVVVRLLCNVYPSNRLAELHEKVYKRPLLYLYDIIRRKRRSEERDRRHTPSLDPF